MQEFTPLESTCWAFSVVAQDAKRFHISGPFVYLDFFSEYFPRSGFVEVGNMSLTPNGSPAVEAAGIEHIDGLYSYALVLTRNRSDAEDLVQETYVRAIGAMGRLRGDSNVKSWLFTILRNIWFNQLRQRRTAKLVALDG
jgi:hypothetical protein